VVKKGKFNIRNEKVIHANLVDPQKVLLHPLHIKPGVMKQFVKALDKSGSCFQYLGRKFAALSEAKVKEGMLDGSQIRQLMKDTAFTDNMSDIEIQTWNAFKDVVKKFLGNAKDPQCEKIVGNMLEKLHILGYNISLKLHFLHFHLDYFRENLGDLSEEQGERFYQDVKEMEGTYLGRWDVSMMADYCWSIKRGALYLEHERKSSKHSFATNQKRKNSGPNYSI
jgi:hypothetical protein